MWAIHSALIETRQMMSIPEFISCIIVLYIQPILCLFGILFNSGCLVVFIMVWSNKDYYRKTAMILYFGAMSLCNIVQLLLSFFVIILPAFEQAIKLVKNF
uniref:Uncharacterized protein n=1 Tax=Meloidogyne enterolobii TaxID=390850 RepID=A0A6V7V8U9_MELEN|nr:unnamed protein product [Meloidogyne enterolobii]